MRTYRSKSSAFNITLNKFRVLLVHVLESCVLFMPLKQRSCRFNWGMDKVALTLALLAQHLKPQNEMHTPRASSAFYFTVYMCAASGEHCLYSWAIKCWLSLRLYAEFQGQRWHWKGLSPVWVRRCETKPHFWLKALSQWSHLYGRSPVCIIMCFDI